jgi:hypothetical protein
VDEKREEANENERVEVTRKMISAMSSQLVAKLWASGREAREAKEKGQAEAEVTGRLLSIMSSRLVTKLWVSG